MSLTITGMRERISDKRGGITQRIRGIQKRNSIVAEAEREIRVAEDMIFRANKRIEKQRKKLAEKSTELRIAEANLRSLENALAVFLREGA